MKCDLCEKEATVHEVTVRNSAKVEKHLCESCAAKQGIAKPASTPPIEELMSKILLAPGAAGGAAQQRGTSCPHCKMTFAEFRQCGLLGCSGCYEAFETQLSPLVERAHEGGERHAGKHPKRALAGSDHEPQLAELAALAQRAEQLRRIHDELKQAIAREEYERAAKLRDEIKKLDQSMIETPARTPRKAKGPGKAEEMP